MENGDFWRLGRISDAGLRQGLDNLLGASCRTEARIVAHLAEVEARKLFLRDGFSSMFVYCQRQLGLSENEAFHRIAAARVARRFPTAFGMLERREIHLSALCLLREHLTLENHEALLNEAMGKTKLQLQELIVRRFPKGHVEDSVRKLPQSRTVQTAASAGSVATLSAPGATGETAATAGTSAETPLLANAPTVIAASAPTNIAPFAANEPLNSTPSRAASKPPRPAIEPISEATYRVQFEASRRVKEKLDLARELGSHSNPSGKLEVIVEQALDLWLDKVQKRRFALTSKPRTTSARGSARKPTLTMRNSRAPKSLDGDASPQDTTQRSHLPHTVRREVASRDELQCTYVSAEGYRCNARAFLQFHHETPWACGGEDDANNVRLLCQPHNRLLAERDFGVAHVSQKMSEKQSQRPGADTEAPKRAPLP